MKERPISYTVAMAEARRQRLKSKTRRTSGLDALNENPSNWVIRKYFEDGTVEMLSTDHLETVDVKCPYGVVGDRLWVRESWRTPKDIDSLNASQIAKKCEEAGFSKPWCPVEYGDGARVNWADWDEKEAGRRRVVRFMPRWLSRGLDELVSWKIERLHDITLEDALLEGVGLEKRCKCPSPLEGYGCSDCQNTGYLGDPLADFKELWNSINAGKYPFDFNPWVWVLEFRPVNPFGDLCEGRR